MKDFLVIKSATFVGHLLRGGCAWGLSLLCCLSFARAVAAGEGPPPATLPVEIIPEAEWEDPAGPFRPVARWWWPGGSVDSEGLAEHLQRMADAGFGSVEVQPLLLGIGEDDLAADPRLRSVGTPAFFERLAQAAAAAEKTGLAFDLTLGSGWPGGLPTAKKNAERQLLMAAIDFEGPSSFEGSLPTVPDQSYRGAVEWVLDVLGPPDPDAQVVAVLAVRLGPEEQGATRIEEVRDLGASVVNGQLRWEVPPGSWRALVFYTNSTEHFVMGGAFPGQEADARVVDHLSRRGADALIDGYGAPAFEAIGPGGVRGVFVDSFELMGELPFTGDFPQAFKKIAGYEITPHLPVLFRQGGESKYAEMIDFLGRNGGPIYTYPGAGRAQRIREDYEAVRRALFEEEFVQRFADWAKKQGVEFRLQAHGGYGDYLDTYALSDVPEAEGLFGAGSFDFLKFASSAAHVKDRRWASSEAFITLRFFGRRLSEDEMKLLAGRAYSAGINRLVFHGVSYPYQRQDGETWYPFSGGFGRILAGPLPMSSEIDAQFLKELPDFNRFLARLSLAMSQGDPQAEIAWLRADPAYPDSASLQWGRIEPKAGESTTTATLRGRGLGHDRISRRMLADAKWVDGGLQMGARTYRALLLDPLPVAEPELVERVAELAEAGVPVVALGRLPQRAPGARDAEARDARVRKAVARIGPRVHRASDEDELGELLATHVRGDLFEPVPGERLEVSILRRRTVDGEIVLVFNESWSPAAVRLRATRKGGALRLWDPESGGRTDLAQEIEPGEVISFDLEPAQTVILTVAQPPASRLLPAR